MRRLFRTVGVALLVAASLNASAGLCFCHRGTDTPASLPGGHGCCHEQDPSGTLVLHAGSSCCHIEAAARDATSADAAPLVQPGADAVPIHESAALRVFPPVATTVSAPSPPVRVLRI